MLFSLTVAIMLSAPTDEPKPAGPPAKKELFAAEEWYKSQEGKETAFVGTLKYSPRAADVVGFNRFNAFSLTFDKPEGKLASREVYVGANEAALKDYAGRKIRLIGKKVDMEVEGKMHFEIWPARVELIEADPPKDLGKPVKILGRATWRASTKPGASPQQLVIRSEAEFAKTVSAGNDAKNVLENLAKQLKVDAIDWNKHMLVVVSAGAQRTGGYRVEVLGVYAREDKLTVHWKLHSPKPTDFVTMAFTHPAETVLIESSDRKVMFDPDSAIPPKK